MRIPILLSALGACLLLAPPAPAASQPRPTRTLERALDRAERELDQDRPERALRWLRRAAANAPTDARLAVLATRLLSPDDTALTASGGPRAEFVLALPAPLPALADDPERARLRTRWLASFLLAEAETAGDVATFPITLQDAEGARWLRWIAGLAVRRDDLGLAQTALERALQAWPQDPAPRRELAMVLLARGEPLGAVSILRTLRRTDPDNVPLRVELAGALLAAGDDGALTEYGALARLGPEHAVRHGLAALELGQPHRAEEVAREVLEAAPNTDAAWAILGLSLVAQGRLDEARPALRRGVSDPAARAALHRLEGTEQETPATEHTETTHVY